MSEDGEAIKISEKVRGEHEKGFIDEKSAEGKAWAEKELTEDYLKKQKLVHEKTEAPAEKKRENLELMKGLKEVYPNSFTTLHDEKGEMAIVANVTNQIGSISSDMIIFTEEGVGVLDLKRRLIDHDDLDLTILTDKLLKKNKSGSLISRDDLLSSKAHDKGKFADDVVFRSVDLTIPVRAKEVKQALQSIETRNMGKKARTEKNIEASKAVNVLKSLS